VTALSNSLAVTFGATAIAAGLGMAVAVTAAISGRRVRNIWLALAALALALPPFLSANVWLELTQAIRSNWTPEQAETAGLPITAGVLGLMLWPIPAFAAVTAWDSLSPGLLEAEPRLRGRRLLGDLLLPAALPAVGRSLLVTGFLALTQFAVPVLFQVRVLPEMVWIRFNTRFDTMGALEAAAPMIAAGLLTAWALRRREPAWPRLSGPVDAGLLRERLGNGWRLLFVSIGGIAVLAGLGLPLVRLAAEPRTWNELPGAFAAGLPSILHSFASSALAATGLCTAGLLLTGALGGRIRGPGPAWLGFLVPGVVLSIAWIFLLNRPGLQGIATSPLILVLALGVRYLAPAWAGIAAAVRAADPDLIDAARLNAGPGMAFRTGLWPQIRGPVCTVWSVTYLLCLWEVESILLIVPPGGETLAMRIFNLLHYGHAGQVNALCVLLLALAVGPTAILSWIGRSPEARVPLHPEP